jgi:glycosyltransferase involved in cell wall biosynthesis
VTPRVLIVTPWGERLGGAEEMLWLALSHLDRARLDPTVVFLGPGPFEEEVRKTGIETVVIQAGRLRQLRAAFGSVERLSELIERRRPEILLSWSAKAHLYTAASAARARIGGRLVWWQHTTPEGHWLERMATVLPAKAIGCSSKAGQLAQAELWPRRETFVVNPGIVVGPEPTRDNVELRARLGISSDATVVGIVGRLQPNKGQHRFLEVVAALLKRGRKVHGLVVGGDAHDLSPEYVPHLDRLIVDLGIERAVTMTGQVSDARPYFELMDFAVNASEQESFPLTLMEAMAAGAIVVTAGRDGRSEIVEEGVNGLLTVGTDPVEFADKIDCLLGDADRRRELAARARRASVERFSADRMADELASWLEEVLDA